MFTMYVVFCVFSSTIQWSFPGGTIVGSIWPSRPFIDLLSTPPPPVHRWLQKATHCGPPLTYYTGRVIRVRSVPCQPSCKCCWWKVDSVAAAIKAGKSKEAAGGGTGRSQDKQAIQKLLSDVTRSLLDCLTRQEERLAALAITTSSCCSTYLGTSHTLATPAESLLQSVFLLGRKNRVLDVLRTIGNIYSPIGRFRRLKKDVKFVLYS